ncbi:MAG: leucine-rich repeat domain-containing protein [Muribaculaceae bacterium]|nr:leucine-rich repeat domain-containing protein [Muribaculaceae bacterium]
MKIFSLGALALTGFMAAVAPGAYSLTVTTGAGGLRQAVGADTDATSLVVSGSINAVDFDFISQEMRSLDNLDLSGATVVAYSGEATFNGRTEGAPGTLPEGALMSVKARTIHLPSTLSHIGDGALADIDATTIVIPRFVETIGRSAFSNSRNLETVIIPASVRSVGNGAFSGCTALRSVEIAGSLESISPSVFQGCVSLSSVVLPSELKQIGNNAFAGCSSLDNIIFPAGLETLGERAFYGASLHSVDLSFCENLTSVAPWAFAANKNLVSVALPEGVTTIGAGAFFDDSTLALNELPSTLQEIDDYALKGIGAAQTELIAGTAVERLGNYSLAGWKGVQKFEFPPSLGYIGDCAMAGWSDLAALSAETTVRVPALGADVWSGVDQNSVVLTVPTELLNEYSSTPQWKEFKVQAGSTGKNETAAVDASVEARFEGLTLVLTAPQTIAGVEIFDAVGRRFTLPSAADSTGMRVDTSAWSSPVMIVRIVMADGSAAAMKLSR